MNQNMFTILLLADAHIGNPMHKLDALSVFDPLYKDIKEIFNKDQGVPSLIVFAGDLAYSGHEKEYVEAEEFLKNICLCFNKKYGEIPILIVPGNHDIDRDMVDEAQKKYRDDLTASAVDEMVQNGKLTWTRIIQRQQSWQKFVKKIPGKSWDMDEKLNLCTGMFSLAGSGKTIGIAGFNSSWASHEQKEQGKLWIGQFQYLTAYHAIKESDFKIAIAHHPVDWLHPDEKSIILQRIESQFNIFCHGHEHAQWFNDSKGYLK